MKTIWNTAFGRFAGLFLALAIFGPSAFAGYNSNTRVNVPDGKCSFNGDEKAAFLCDITDGGTIVEAITGSDGSFPKVINGRSYFEYRVTDDGLGASPSHLDFELPICDSNYGQPDLVALLNKDLSGPGGIDVSYREESTGVTFPNAMVLKIDKGVPSGGWQKYTVVFNSDSISAEPIDFAIKTGDGVEYSGMGILGAGCGIVDQITKKYCKSQTVIEDEEFGIIGYRSHFIGKIRNKGQVALYDPKIQEYNTNLYCEITSVNGLPIVPAVPIPNEANRYVKVPTNAKFDGILDPADPGKKYGETVTFGIDCEHDEPNLVNVLNSKVFTAGGVPIPGSAKSNMARQCPLEEELAIEIDKTCDGVNPGERLMAMDGHLVVEICPRIRVSNKGREMLYDVTVTDDKVDGLKVGLNIGSLAPDETVDLGDDLGVDTCYMPSAPNEPAVGDHGTPNDPSDDKYDPERATFTNTAEVTARGEDGGNTTDMDSATCSLADTGVPDQD